MIKVTIQEIEEDLCNLDSEYRESLAKGLVKLKFLSDTPLKLFYGDEEDNEEFERVYSKLLNSKELKNIINFISNDMKDDFQFGYYNEIANRYNELVESMIEEEKLNEFEM